MNAVSLPSNVGMKPWQLPTHGLALFEGSFNTARLSHYFLPSLIGAGKSILFLDGANAVDPRLMSRLGQRRGIPFERFNRRVRVCRAFTCFQLTELIARVPKFLAEFRAAVVIVTAFPELYLDGDIRDWDARVAFERGLDHLRALTQSREFPLVVGVFSSYGTFAPSPARRRFFQATCAAATEVWKFQPGEDGKLRLLPAANRLKR